MRKPRSALVVLSVGLVLLCWAEIAAAQTQQCTVQGTYPSPLDESGNPIGSLLQVNLSSKVGVVLDDIPQSMRDGAAQWYIAQPSNFWKKRAIKQIELAQYRLNFRNYYVLGQGALPIPYSDLWNIHIVGTPHRAIYQSGKKNSPVDAVWVDFTMDTVILSDANSPSTSTGHRLDNPGDVVTMDFGLPLDPTLLFQRSGRACYNEYGYPPKSVDPASEPWFYYDDTCTASNARPLNKDAFACGYCHCDFPRPTLDCVDALALKEGLVQATFSFTRLPWSKNVADQYRFLGPADEILPPVVQGAADLVGFKKDLAKQREIYRYFPPNSCEAREQCIGAAGGWRKVIMFYSTDVNNGTRDMHIGDVPYVTGKTLPDPIINNGDYVFDQCHGHYHFEHYGNFSFVDKNGNDVAGDQQKRGLCLIDLFRLVNAEWSPLTIKYFDCKYQGITAGWADVYNIGIPCQWKDVTETPPGNYFLKTHLNPDKILCEGALQCDGAGNQIWDDTSFTTCSSGYTPQVCEVAQAARCSYPMNASNVPVDTSANNIDVAPAAHRQCGLSYVTDAVSPLGLGQEIGPLRDTEFSFYGNIDKRSDQVRSCSPGAPSKVTCSVPAKSPAQVVRICDSSQVLGCATACRYHESLANVAIQPGEAVAVNFSCPVQKDGGVFGENGGAFSIYTALVFGPDGATQSPDVSCVAQ